MRARLMVERLISLKHPYRRVLLVMADIFLISVCYLSCWLLINGRISIEDYLPTLLVSWGLFVLVFSIVFTFFGMYNNLWRYAEAYEYSKCILATLIASLVFVVLTGVFLQPPRFAYRVPISIYFLSSLMAGMSALILRVLYRAIRITRMGAKTSQGMKKVMLVGAGETGNAVLYDIAREKKRRYDVVCIVDDDVNKIGRQMQRIKVAGSTYDIPLLVERYGVEVIILAMPSITGEDKRRITSICSKTKCQLKKVPDLYSLVTGDASILRQIEDVSVEDLLGREVVDLQNQGMSYLKGKTVLITGAGGSIGSELCRQAMRQAPFKLVMVDIYENGVYDIQQELLRKYGDNCSLVVEIASVRDRKKIELLFNRHKPQVVYHAAAHKHVPLMEAAPEEAVKNNVFGTLNVAECASEHGAEKFVLISTDKAVNPTNVMGATKRVCEMIIQCLNSNGATEFVAVRFGNVLGSNGSVIPLFKKQVQEGGPLTVTDPEVIRYFMTIPEAVSLVLTAGAMARGGEIFVLDMGSPVKILDLAESIIRLSGYEPYVDIDIKITGMRPGEKMYEELLIGGEALHKTENEKIFVERTQEIEKEKLWPLLQRLRGAVERNESGTMYVFFKEIVPGFVGENNALG